MTTTTNNTYNNNNNDNNNNDDNNSNNSNNAINEMVYSQTKKIVMIINYEQKNVINKKYRKK